MAYENVGPSLGGNTPILLPGQVPGVAPAGGGGVAPTGGSNIPITPQPAQSGPIPIQQTPMSVSPNSSGGPISQQSSTITQYIVQARNQGVDDDAILNGLRTSGLVPMENAPTQPQGEGAQLHDTGSFLGNLGNSVSNFAGGVGNAIMHPIDTATALGKVGLGVADELGVVKLIPGLDANVVKQAKDAGILKEADTAAYNFLGFLGTRYGSWDAIKKTAYQDPVGFLADASAALSGAGGALGIASGLGKAGEISDAARLTGEVGQATTASKIASAAGTAGEFLSKAGDLTNPINMAAGALTKTLGLAKAGLEGIGPALEKAALRLTPVQKSAWASKLPEITDYISKYIPAGNPEARFEAAGTRVDQFENVISDFIKQDAVGITKNCDELIAEASALKNGFYGERDALEMDRQIEGFTKLLEAKYPDEIPLADIQDLKRSTFKNAFNQAGTKISDTVEYSLGDLLKTTIEKKTENLPVMGKYPISEINKAYGTALNAKKLLRIAMGRPQVDFVSRLITDFTGSVIGSAVGTAMGGPVGTAIGGAGGAAIGDTISKQAPVTRIKSVIGKTARGASNIIPKIKLPANAGNVANVLIRSKKATENP